MHETMRVKQRKRGRDVSHMTARLPVRSASQLAEILGSWPLAPAMLERVEFAPSDSTAPEAPGA